MGKYVSFQSIKKLIIKNFGRIGSNSIELEIDKIVILVGANNAGREYNFKSL